MSISQEYMGSPFLSYVASFFADEKIGIFPSVAFSTLHAVLFLTPLIFIAYYADAKLAADSQMRIGPNRVGVAGLLQPFSDFIKLLLKENKLRIVGVFGTVGAGPVFALAMVFAAFSSIPISSQWSLVNFEWSILFSLTAMVVSQYVLFYPSYAQGSPWSVVSSLRSVFLGAAYIAPLLMSLAPVFIISGGGSFTSVLAIQSGAPWGWILFNYPTTSASMLSLWFLLLIWQNRAPFNVVDLNPEVCGGIIGSYGGSRLGALRLLSFSQLVLGSAIIVTLFLGGYKFPFELTTLERASNIFEYLVFLFKVAIVVAISLWTSYSMPRTRADQVSYFSWHLLMPLGVLSYILTLIWMGVFNGKGLWVR